jgi:hypothetical protein
MLNMMEVRGGVEKVNGLDIMKLRHRPFCVSEYVPIKL